MPDPFHTRTFAGFELAWAEFSCDSMPLCAVAVHTVGLVGFDFDGVDRWIPVTELIDATVGDAERSVLAAAESDERTVEGWRLLAAAFGLPWSVLDIAQVRRCASVCFGLSPVASNEMWEQGVEGLLTLRRYVGRSDLGAVPELLADMHRYRLNVGGELKDWGDE